MARGLHSQLCGVHIPLRAEMGRGVCDVLEIKLHGPSWEAKTENPSLGGCDCGYRPREPDRAPAVFEEGCDLEPPGYFQLVGPPS